MRRLFLSLFLSGSTLAPASPLFDSILKGDLDAFQKTLTEENAHVANPFGVRPLNLAAQNGNASILALLLAEKASPNAPLTGGESPLHSAARVGSAECLRLLLAAGAKVDATEHHGQTPLMWASAAGHNKAVQTLLLHGADASKTHPSGFNSLLFATRGGHSEVVQTLLKAGCDLNHPANPKRPGRRNLRRGSTALTVAIENGHFSLAIELLKAGADANDLRSGVTSLHALTWVRKSVKGDGDDGLAPPRGSGKATSLDLARALCAHGADPNARLTQGRGGVARLDRKGCTPFLMACETGDVPYLKVLLELGADPHLKNHIGTGAVLAAAGMGVTAPGEEASDERATLDTLAFLLDLGFDLNAAVDQRKETVMHAAAYKSSPAVMEFLDSHGADPTLWHQKNKSGWTPLRITQGYRPGNFRPIEATEKALIKIMHQHGLE